MKDKRCWVRFRNLIWIRNIRIRHLVGGLRNRGLDQSWCDVKHPLPKKEKKKRNGGHRFFSSRNNRKHLKLLGQQICGFKLLAFRCPGSGVVRWVGQAIMDGPAEVHANRPPRPHDAGVSGSHHWAGGEDRSPHGWPEEAKWIHSAWATQTVEGQDVWCEKNDKSTEE